MSVHGWHKFDLTCDECLHFGSLSNDPLRAPGTDDDVSDAETRATFAEWRKRFADANADPPADRRPFALAVLIIALAVVAIVWWPR